MPADEGRDWKSTVSLLGTTVIGLTVTILKVYHGLKNLSFQMTSNLSSGMQH